MKKIYKLPLNMVTKNRNTEVIYSTNDTAIANSSYMINFGLQLPELKYRTLTKTVLRFRQKNETTAKAYLMLANENEENQNNKVALNVVLDGEVSYREVDVTNYYLNDNLSKGFNIICDNGELQLYTNASEYEPEITIEYISEEESILNQKHVEGSCNTTLDYKINLRSGRPIYKKHLVENSVMSLPFSLGVYYDPNNGSTSSLSMPNGWDFTYNQKVYQDGVDYKYKDGNGILHTFKQALNSTNIYYDIAGTGLILTINDVNLTIEDGYNNYLYFGTGDGYLFRIEKRIGESSFDLILMRNFNTGDLAYIYDSYKINNISRTTGIDYSISYNNNNIIISSSGCPNIILTKDNNNNLVSIIEEDSRISTYTYENNMLKEALSDNKEKVQFTYDSIKRVSNVKNSIHSIDSNGAAFDNIINEVTFEYGYLTTNITDYHGVKKGYTFDDEGILIGEFEVTDGVSNKGIYIENDDKVIKVDINKDIEHLSYCDLMASGKEDIVTLIKSGGNLSVEQGEDFRLSFIYNFEYGKVDYEKTTYIKIYQGDSLLAAQNLDLRRTLKTNCSVNFKAIDGNEISVKVEHNNEEHCVLNLKNIMITKSSNIEYYRCTSKEFDNPTTFGRGNNLYYPFVKTEFKYNNILVPDGNMYYEDLLENQKNMALNPASHHIWYNKKKGLVANTNNVLLKQNNDYIALNTFTCATVKLENGYQYVDYIDYEDDNVIENFLYKKVSCVFVDVNEYNLFFEYIDRNFRTARYMDSKNQFWSLIADYVYNDFGNVVEERISNTVDQKQISTMYNYDKNRLLSKTTHINDNDVVTTYTTNEHTGRLEKITYPDGSEKVYEYYPNTTNKFKSLSQIVGSNNNSNEISYDKDKITNYKGINSGYNLEYDKYNMLSSFIDNQSYLFNVYRNISPNQNQEQIAYPNNFLIRNTYDKYGNLIKCENAFNGPCYDVLKYFYSDLHADDINTTSPDDPSLKKSANSKLKKVIDETIANSNNIYYDEIGNIKKLTNSNIEYKPAKVEYEYDDINRLKTIKYDEGTREENINYNYIFGDIISGYNSKVAYNTGNADKIINSNVIYHKDYFDRIIKESITTVEARKLDREYTYVEAFDKATNLIKTITYKKDSVLVDKLNYEYDNMGRIIRVYNTSNSVDTSYEYDSVGRLVRENNKELNKSFKIYYDKNGNITSKISVAYTLGNITNFGSINTYNYSPDYSDRLVKYNGQVVETSSLGNVRSIGSKTYAWSKVKQLSQVNYGNNNYVNYYYDGFGIRTQKLSYKNGLSVNHKYITDNGRILKEVITGGIYEGVLNYIYLGNEVVGFTYKDKEYFFQKNLQGDIINIYDNTNTLVASYVYDAWGNHIITLDVDSIGTINPFRYRGYYYDEETQLYWVSSRYYSPELCRWISPDSIEYLDPESINGLNLYAYCANDPINKYDPTGHFPWLILAAAILLFTPVGGTVAQVATSALSYAGIWVASRFDEDIKNDMRAIGWNPFNTDESATLNSSKVSFYKGVPVFRTAAGGRSGSFGAIFLTKDSVEDDLRHERGHNWQLMMMGIGTYGFTVGIPSPLKLGPWAKNNRYYYAPWETMADILGGVNQRYGKPIPQQQIKNAWMYYAMSTICFPLTAFYWL